MKTIQQLLQLSKNPYYKFTRDEQAVLDDFLLNSREPESEKSPKKSSKGSSKKTRAIVRNVVKKTDTYPPEVAESYEDSSQVE